MRWRGGSVATSQNPYISNWIGWAQEVWGTLGGSPEHPEQREAVGEEGRQGPSRGGQWRGSPPGPYMVVEARLVSSCLSLPSRARPRFSRLAESMGVTEYVLEKVELAATFSLVGSGEESSEPAPAWWALSTRRGCSASHQAPGQSPTPPPALPPQPPGPVSSFRSLIQPLLFSTPRLCCSPPGPQGRRGCRWSRRCKARRGSSWGGGQLRTFPQGPPRPTPACAGGHSVHSLPSPLLPLHLLF